ncbi:hypothetical protein RhiirA5_369832 [Rhizophagus irregularis]|uniref:Uncharacterized protein n=2 Tax=Rhizophagus irregularis TaxID=588596 RepID=A0A2N0QBL4_9GLOM|nr:hypothetical protein RhiirA5_369832 [Rhizophagus irregularis]
MWKWISKIGVFRVSNGKWKWAFFVVFSGTHLDLMEREGSFVLQTASSGNLKLLLKKRFLSLDGFNKVDLMYSQPQYIATCLCKNMKYEGIIDEDRGEMLLYIVLGMPNEVNINKKSNEKLPLFIKV